MQCLVSGFRRGFVKDYLPWLAISFSWTNSSKEKGIHWVHREVIRKEKECGGMGFRNFEASNISLLMKQIWRI